MQAKSADSCRTREIEGVRTVELVCVGGLLRMSDESALLPVRRSVGGGFTGKGDLDVWVVRQLPGNQETSMGAEWPTSQS